MKIKAPFTFKPWSKVTKAWGRQCNRHFDMRDAYGHYLGFLTFWANGWRSLYKKGDGTVVSDWCKDGIFISGWYTWKVHEKGYLRDSL